MKKTFLLLGVVVCVSANGYSQTATQENKKVLIDTRSNSNVAPQPERTLEFWDSFIYALETKRELVNANPAEKEKAEASGWFKHIDAELENARIERNKLLQKNN